MNHCFESTLTNGHNYCSMWDRKFHRQCVSNSPKVTQSFFASVKYVGNHGLVPLHSHGKDQTAV